MSGIASYNVEGEREIVMIEFERLKSSYYETVQIALLASTSGNEAKNGNQLIHSLCNALVDSSNYCDSDKKYMKQELELLKNALDQEIDQYLHENDSRSS